MKKMMIILICLLSVCFVSCSKNQSAAPAGEFKAENARQEYYYAMGNNFAKMYSQYYEDMDLDAFMAGINAYKYGTVISDADIETIVNRYYNEVVAKMAETNLAAANAFLEENGKKDGVITTKSGLQYKILEQGSGNTPSASAMVEVKYTLSDLAGNVLDTSGDEGVFFFLTDVIPGFSEAVMLMNPGTKITAWIHPDLGYGENGSGSVGPQSLLVFNIELVSVTEE